MAVLEKGSELKNLESLYIEQLRDLYSAESQLLEALPKLADSAATVDLKTAFENHLDETRQQRDQTRHSG